MAEIRQPRPAPVALNQPRDPLTPEAITAGTANLKEGDFTISRVSDPFMRVTRLTAANLPSPHGAPLYRRALSYRTSRADAIGDPRSFDHLIFERRLFQGSLPTRIPARHEACQAGSLVRELYAWRKALSAAADEAATAAARAGMAPPDFVVITDQASARAAAIEIEVAGARVRVSSGVDPALLADVLRTLKALG